MIMLSQLNFYFVLSNFGVCSDVGVSIGLRNLAEECQRLSGKVLLQLETFSASFIDQLSSNSLMMTVATGFLSLPVELICYILFLLAPRDLCRCAMVCSFRDYMFIRC